MTCLNHACGGAVLTNNVTTNVIVIIFKLVGCIQIMFKKTKVAYVLTKLIYAVFLSSEYFARCYQNFI
jgi:hypothetical protein